MRKIVFLIFVTVTLFMCSCSPVISNDADEIRLNKWLGKYRNGSTAVLSFNGDRAEFAVDSKDKAARVKLSGLCVFDGDKFALYDESDGGEYIFYYKLKRNRLTLSYDDGKISLTRE